MYSLCLGSPQWHLVTGRAVLLFVGLGLVFFIALSSLVLVIKKCGLGMNVPRWGRQHGPVHKITAGLELLSKFRLFLRKEKLFTVLFQPRLKYLWQPINLLQFLPKFKRKINYGLGSRSDSVAVKAVPGQAMADHKERGGLSHSTAQTTPSSILQSQQGAALLQALRPWLCPTHRRSLGLCLDTLREKFTRSYSPQFHAKCWLCHGYRIFTEAASRLVHPLMWSQGWN